MACVYVLYSKISNKPYTGSTRDNDPNERLKAHNYGKTRSTKSGRPWEIVHVEKFDTYAEARKRELLLKSGIGRKWIKENIGIRKN